MRPIKFRGKYKHNPTGWVYGSGVATVVDIYGNPTEKRVLVGWADLDATGGKDDCFGYDEVISETIGQYTGFKDNKGVEIYEGDILMDEDGCKAEVYYNLYLGRFDLHYHYREEWWKLTGLAEWLNYNNSKLFAVVGNIHE